MDKRSDLEQEFPYGLLMLQALSLPNLVLLSFGGKPTMISLCFGTLVAYIFDLLGILEVTVISVAVTMIIIWVTLVFSARYLLQESLLNFGMVGALATVLIFTFTCIAGHFRGLRNEMDTIFYFFETVIIASIPLLCSSVITWFLCVELPVLDLPVCFSSCYFLYMLIMGKPRLPSSSSSTVTTKDQEAQPKYILSRSVLLLIYIIPVIISPILHITLHWNVLAVSSLSRIIGILVSALYPTLLMCSVAENQLAYWDEAVRLSISSQLSSLKLLVTLLLVLCLQSHPLLDDLKIFSTFSEFYSSFFLGGIVLLVFLAIFIHRYYTPDRPIMDEAYFDNADKIKSKIKSSDFQMENPLVSIFIGGAAVLLGLLFDLNIHVFPFTIIGAISLAEFSQRQNSKTRSIKSLNLTLFIDVSLLFIAGFGGALTVASLAYKTIWFLDYSMEWLSIVLNLKQMCVLSIGLGAVATVAQIAFERPTQNLLGTYIDPFGEIDRGYKSHTKYFAPIFFFAFNVITALFETMVRVQDWQNIGTTVEVVYPSYLLGGTALLFIVTAIHLYNNLTIGLPAVLSTFIIQCLKLLPLLGVQPIIAIDSAIIIIIFSVPFVVNYHYLLGKYQHTDITTGFLPVTATPPPSYIQLVVVMILAAWTSYRATINVCPMILAMILQKQPDGIQVDAACATVFFCYSTVIVTVFGKKSAVLRTALLLLAALSALVATEALGPLSLSIDPDSSTYAVLSVHPELATDHTPFFLVLTVILALMGTTNIYPIRQPSARLLFSIIFSFCTAKVLYGWGFPRLLEDKGKFRSHSGTGMWELPWMYSLFVAVLTTSTILHAFLPHTTAMGRWMFTLCGCAPVLASAWAFVAGSLTRYLAGILWVVAAAQAAIAVTTRLAELSRDILTGGGLGANQSDGVDRVHSSSVCAISSLLAINWAIMATAVSPHVLADLIIPLFFLLFLCTRSGLLLKNTHPVSIVALACTMWWLYSSFYSVFIMGSAMSSNVRHTKQFGLRLGIFEDVDVSMWTVDSHSMRPFGTVMLALTPLPAIILSFLRRKNESEDWMLVYTICSALPIIGGQIWSVRFLGLLGLVYGGWRLRDIGLERRNSDRII